MSLPSDPPDKGADMIPDRDVSILRSVATPTDRTLRSVRRTCSFQTRFPDGPGTDLHITAAGRDICVGERIDDVTVISQVTCEFLIGPDRRIRSALDPSGQHDLSFLEGLQVGREVREAKAATLKDDVDQASLTHRLIEELSAMSFLAPGAYLAWAADLDAYRREFRMGPRLDRPVEGLCISYQRGSASMTDDGRSNMDLINQPIGYLAARRDDPWAFHDVVIANRPELIRLRRQDLWWEEGRLRVDFAFQDSAAKCNQAKQRQIFHEYHCTAQVAPDDLRLVELCLEPGSLPFSTCPAADTGALSLIGEVVSAFDSLVTTKLAGTAGCTHLNSALRTLADVPKLAAFIPPRAGKD
jgi:hypothetical protein